MRLRWMEMGMKRSTVGGYVGDGNKKVVGVLLPSCKRSKGQLMFRVLRRP